jgi:transposase-like protein
MGQVLHGSATTTEAIRRAIQHSEESLRALAKRYGINQITVAKWRKRASVGGRPVVVPSAQDIQVLTMVPSLAVRSLPVMGRSARACRGTRTAV